MRILLPIDSPKFSEAAVQSVGARLWPRDTEIRVLHVAEPLSLLLGREMSGHDPEFEAVWKALREEAKASVAKVAEGLRRPGPNVTSALIEGYPKSQIIDAANNWPAELIVLGAH
jgi:nucleotide-binding universal stress UspA family protein